MADPLNLSTPSLDALQSQEQQSLLNEIDKLRAYGVSDFVSLPQLVVCGDQSSGKSSVLEAITEIPFPTKDNLCTRFATQIVLRRAPYVTIKVRILPASKSDEARQKSLRTFGRTLEKLEKLPDLVDEAKVAMGVGVSGTGNRFSRDVLSVEISGPGRPQLTVVDLPGLIHTADSPEGQSEVELVSELVQKYMVDDRTIILAVVSAKNDHQNQIVLQRARQVDPDGRRTLGIITKPDTLSVGSQSELEYLALARNEKIPFKLGWAVVRNRSYEERNDPFEKRNLNELQFFERGSWNELPGECVGISKLRSRLSTLLLNHIKQELPRVYSEIENELKICGSRLEKMGQSRGSVEDQRIVLFKIAEQFDQLCKAAVGGTYEHQFFSAATESAVVNHRLRAAVQNLNADFSKTMLTRGHWKKILEDKQKVSKNVDGKSVRVYSDEEHDSYDLPAELASIIITRKEAVQWVKPIMQRSRGRELPGNYQPLVIGELFWQHSQPWEIISTSHVQSVWETCYAFVLILLQELAPEDIIHPLLANHVNARMQERLDRAMSDLNELLNDRRIVSTYNHYYTETVQKIRNKRVRLTLKRTLSSFGTAQENGQISVNSDALLNSLVSSVTEPNMDDYASEEVLDCMLAYYKVASKTFIDNVATIVVERRIVRDLGEVFMPYSVVTMPPHIVSLIAAESNEDQMMRAQLEGKRSSLENGLEVCQTALKGARTGAIGKFDPLKILRGLRAASMASQSSLTTPTPVVRSASVSTLAVEATSPTTTAALPAAPAVQWKSPWPLATAAAMPSPTYFNSANRPPPTTTGSLFAQSSATSENTQPASVPGFMGGSFGSTAKSQTPKPSSPFGIMSNTADPNKPFTTTSSSASGATAGGSLFTSAATTTTPGFSFGTATHNNTANTTASTGTGTGTGDKRFFIGSHSRK